MVTLLYCVTVGRIPAQLHQHFDTRAEALDAVQNMKDANQMDEETGVYYDDFCIAECEVF